MKNTPLRLGLLVVIATILFHTSFAQKTFMLGVKGGIDIPNLRGSSDDPVSRGWSTRLGPYFGIVSVYTLTEKLSLQAELNYSSQGAKRKGNQALPTAALVNNPPAGSPEYVWGDMSNEIKLNYFELPILLKLKLPITDNLNFIANGGPYIAYLSSARELASGNTNFYADEAHTQPLLPGPLQFDESQDIKDQIKKFNVGGQVGIGLSTTLLGGEITLTIGGNYGFIPVQKDKNTGRNDTGAATVTLGYLFNL